MPTCDKTTGSLRTKSVRRSRQWRVLQLASGLMPAALLGGLLSGSSAAQELTRAQVAAAIESTLTEAIAASEKSVVAIVRVKNQDRDEAGPIENRADPFGQLQIPQSRPKAGDPDFIPNDFGTGVVVDRHGLILTNYHVLAENGEFFAGGDKTNQGNANPGNLERRNDADPKNKGRRRLSEFDDYYVTTADRKVYPATVKAADPRSDLAILEVKASDLTPIKFGDAGTLKKGQIVIALGNPYAIARDGQASASWGIVSNLSRKAGPLPGDVMALSKSTLHHFGTLIQTDAKLNLGTSGGALVNLKGEMVGLTTSLAAAVGYEQAAGYALPVDETFRRVVDALKQGREVEYGFLGVRPENLAEQEVFAGKQGTRIREVVEGTPAQRYGLLHDDIITHVNDKAVYDADGLMLEVGKLPVDGVARLVVERRGQVVPLNVELSKLFVRGQKIFTTAGPSWRGVQVDYFTAVNDFQLRVRRGDIDLDGCVVVRSVDPESPAWKEGLRADMFITHVGNQRVASPKDFQAATAGKNGPVKIRLVATRADDAVRVIPPAAG